MHEYRLTIDDEEYPIGFSDAIDNAEEDEDEEDDQWWEDAEYEDGSFYDEDEQ